MRKGLTADKTKLDIYNTINWSKKLIILLQAFIKPSELFFKNFVNFVISTCTFSQNYNVFVLSKRYFVQKSSPKPRSIFCKRINFDQNCLVFCKKYTTGDEMSNNSKYLKTTSR